MLFWKYIVKTKFPALCYQENSLSIKYLRSNIWASTWKNKIHAEPLGVVLPPLPASKKIPGALRVLQRKKLRTQKQDTGVLGLGLPSKKVRTLDKRLNLSETQVSLSTKQKHQTRQSLRSFPVQRFWKEWNDMFYHFLFISAALNNYNSGKRREP